jgi:hypothetical protein
MRGLYAEDVLGYRLESGAFDMSDGQVREVVRQIQALRRRIDQPVVERFNISGGEPLIDKRLSAILDYLERSLVATGAVQYITVASNGLRRAPQDLERYLQVWPLRDKPGHHLAMLQDPVDKALGSDWQSVTWDGCALPQKTVAMASSFGWTLCCGAFAYILLFRASDLILPELTATTWQEWPLDGMSRICRHCPFRYCDSPLERDVGRPVSRIYPAAGDRNRELGPLTHRMAESVY